MSSGGRYRIDKRGATPELSEIIVYCKRIREALAHGFSTEHTHRPDLQSLVQSIRPGVVAVNEPKRVLCGAPDFVVLDVRSDSVRRIGYIETKDVGASLNEAESSEQLLRYRAALENIVLTDYLEFRWYVKGELRLVTHVARIEKSGKLIEDREGQLQTIQLLSAFLAQEAEPIRSAEELARRLALTTHLVKDSITILFKEGTSSDLLRSIRQVFAQTLLPDIDKPENVPEFADMFAQTLAYGLFAARIGHGSRSERFRRQDAAAEIPKIAPFLRQLFHEVTGPDLDSEPYAVFVDDLVEILNQTDMDGVLKGFGLETHTEDPIVHFYETFLKAYDPQLREMRGVYFTPQPVVSYLVRSVDTILRRDFECSQGLADTSKIRIPIEEGAADPNNRATTAYRESHRVLVLDPACGTGTFLYAIIGLIRDAFRRNGNAGLWSSYVKFDLLPRLFGFELLMAPYTVAHLKLGMQLEGLDLAPSDREDWAAHLGGEDRLGVYLTNTLKPPERSKIGYFDPFLRAITDEAASAAKVKRDFPIVVVLGNPPYSGESVNKDPWIQKLVRDYYSIDGIPLGEKNPKWLQDDYVKFLRFGEWRIQKTGSGILAFVTNHAYLENPTFRGMRRHLMETFDEIYVLNLHGNSLRRERAPDGSTDSNVFDIQQGVCIGIFIRKLDSSRAIGALGRVHYAELWGQRESKYGWLGTHDSSTTEWRAVEPTSPDHLFTPQDDTLHDEFYSGFDLPSIFPVNSVGIVTARDRLTLHWTEAEVWGTVEKFARLDEPDARREFALPKDARDWKVTLAQADVRESGPSKTRIKPILCKPFDLRYTYYTGRSRGFQCMPRPEVMNHLVEHENLALVAPKRIETQHDWAHALVTNVIVEHCALSAKTIDYVFPLYLYPQNEKPRLTKTHKAALLSADGVVSRTANIGSKFAHQLSSGLSLRFVEDGRGDLVKSLGPQDVMAYVYAILNSPAYQKRYNRFLRMGFPRVPLTRNLSLFRDLVKLGTDLIDLHAHVTEVDEGAQVTFPIAGSNLVEKGFPMYVAAGSAPNEGGAPTRAGRVYINNGDPSRELGQQYFDGISNDCWMFRVGAYQPVQKWLAERRKRVLCTLS